MNSIEINKSGINFTESFLKELDDNGVLVRNIQKQNGIEIDVIEFQSFDGKTMMTITQILNIEQEDSKGRLEELLQEAIEKEDFETATKIKNKLKNN